MKRPFLLLVCLFFIGFTYSQTIVDLYDNDFDSYTPGDYMGVVDPANWEPWGGVPGASDDALVTDAEANTAPNSIVVDEVGGATDAVWKLGDKTSGAYQVGWYMYVQAGFEGYYNFQKTEIPGTEWAFEIYFVAGTAELEVGGTVVGSFNYTEDSWFYMDHFIDLDIDWAEMYFDGTLVAGWAWSNGGLLQLGGVDFYAASNCAYYVDDVNYDQIFSPLYCDDFDQYTAGQWIAQEDPVNWATWGNAPGTPEDGLISDAQALSAPNSILVNTDGGYTDLVWKLGDKTSGSFEVDWYMYIPAGAAAYYNFQKTETPGTEWACDLFFYTDGSAEFQIDQAVIATFSYTQDTWFYMHHVIDLDNDLAEVYYDGTLIHSWAWSNGGLLQLGGVDYYTIDDDYEYYFDDVCFLQTGGSNDPAIAVTPSIYQKIVEQGTTQDDVLNIENVGGGDLIYDIAVVYNVTKDQTVLPDPKPLGRKLRPSDFEAVPTHSTSAPPTDDVTLHWDGDNGTSIGLTNPGDWEAAAMFPSSMIAQYAGMDVSYVDVYINDPDPADAFELRIYGMDNDMVAGALLYSQAFTPMQMSWNTVTLDTPLAVDGQDLWFAIWVDQTTQTHPIGADSGPAVQYGDYIKTGAAWGHLYPSIDANWNIRATLTGTALGNWLTVDPYAGTVAAGDIDQLDVTFDATSMAEGTYQATIHVQSNANATPCVHVPATMVVTPGTGQTSECIDFEGLTAWTHDLDPWMGLDVDGGATWGASDFDFPGEGDPMAFIAFNPALTTPPMTGDPALQPHSGEQFGADFATMPPPFNDDWLISPQISLGLNSEFNFWVKSYTDAYGLEKYNVGISTTGNAPADFTILNSAVLEAPLDWFNDFYDISAYDLQDVYLAVQCVTEDAFIFMIDDVCVNWEPVGVNELFAEDFIVYPNPANTHLNIDATSAIKEIRVFNYVGQLVDSKLVADSFYTLNTSTYKAGIYFVQVQTEKGISTKKVIIE